MDWSNSLTDCLLLFVLFCLLIVISAAETAFLTIRSSQLAELKKSTFDRDKRLLNLLDKPFSLRATFNSAHIFLMVAIVLITHYLFTGWLFGSLNFSTIAVISGLFISFFLVAAGVFLPKVIVQKNNLFFARMTSGLILALTWLMSPFTKLLLYFLLVINRFLNSPFKITEQEFDRIDDHRDINEENEEEQLILRGIANFSNSTVKQIMRPRMDVVAIESSLSFDKVLKQVKEAGYSRLPVYEQSLDSIKGVIHTKDLLLNAEEKSDWNWQKMIRTAFFVPESNKIDDLLRDFKLRRTHLAVVVDEHGGTSGIATLEDVLEELVGEINDEYDEVEDELKYSKLDASNYVFEGKTSLNDLYRIMEIDDTPFEEIRGEADTLGGLVLELAGRFLRINEQVSYNKYIFTVESADKKRIKRVKVTIHEHVE